jgi:hypothetical protein
MSMKPWLGKYFQKSSLPPQATSYSSLPLKAVMEALHIVDSVKYPRNSGATTQAKFIGLVWRELFHISCTCSHHSFPFIG